MKKRILTLMSIILVLIMMAVPVFAAGAGSIAVSPASAQPGDTVTVTLSVSGLGEVTALGITFEVPEGLEYKEAKWLLEGDAMKDVNYAKKQAAFAAKEPILLNNEKEIFSVTYNFWRLQSPKRQL